VVLRTPFVLSVPTPLVSPGQGLPMGAVRNAMERDRQDPTVLDLDPERSLESQRPPKRASGDNGPPLNEDPAFAKYIRMLKMVR